MRTAFNHGAPSRVRSHPRISANKLGEYLIATVARRRQILRDQKNPPDVKVARYADAERAVVTHLVKGDSDPSVLSRHLQRLTEWKPGPLSSEYELQKNQNCREAIQAFQGMLTELPFSGLVFQAGGQASQSLSKSGVSISVRPELLIRGVDRAGGQLAGAVKLCFSKSAPLDQRAAEFVGAILHEYGERFLAEHGAVSYRNFFVIDVFAQRVYPAPRAYARRRSDIEAACEEIASRWDRI